MKGLWNFGLEKAIERSQLNELLWDSRNNAEKSTADGERRVL